MDNNKMNLKKEKELKEVAIVGIGFRIPSGDIKESNSTTEKLWNDLFNGFDGVCDTDSRWSDNFIKNGDINVKHAGLLPLDEWKSFDPLFFGINPSEAPQIDPSSRLLLKCTWEAFEDAGIDPLKLRGSNIPVFTGNSSNDYIQMNRNQNETLSNVFAYTANSSSNRISYCFDLHGESLTLDTACSSSLNAVNLGYQSIKTGKSDLSIASGVNLILDTFASKSFSQINIMSKENGRCKTFDADADGFVRAETVGVVILKNLKQAIDDRNNIYCIINGASSNVDGSNIDKSNFYSPSKSAQSDNIKLSLESTNGVVGVSDIDYVETHGTGTPTGDPVETESIANSLTMDCSFRSLDNPLLIGSIKSNIGHAEAASGIASLIKCCLMFKNRCFAPSIHFKTPNPLIKFDEWNLKVVTQPIPFSKLKTTMIVNNFGVTGSNCCLILSSLPPPNQINQSVNVNKYLIPFSANSISSLKQYQTLIANSNNDLSSFKQFVMKQISRKSLKLIQRSVKIASDWNEFNDEKSNSLYTINSKLTSNMSISSNKNRKSTTVFVFCGQGSQYVTMGKQLYENEPIFKRSMDMLDNKLSKYYGYSVLEKLRSIDEKDQISIHEPINTQPSTLLIQISLFELYKHWGIVPSIIVGHSLGEISAAYCSGMIDLDTFCYLTYHRSISQSKTTGTGKMLSINIGPDEYLSNYASKYPSIEISCYNSPQSIVIAGNVQSLNEISKELSDKGIFNAILGSLSSFHTSSQLMIKEEILSLNIKSCVPKVDIFSTVTCKLFDESTPFNSEYVFENILKPVYFTTTISNLYQHIESNRMDKNVVFIEIAPHPTLQFYLKQMIPKNSDYFTDSISVYSPLSKKKSNDLLEIQTMISQLYCQGYNDINFKCQFGTNEIDNIIDNDFNLPNYQWDDEKYWRTNTISQTFHDNGPPIDHLGFPNSNNSPFIKSYETFIDIQKSPFRWLKGHSVKGKFYFPGCGYIDNILKIFCTNESDKPYKQQDLIISFLEFKTPLILIEGVNQCLQTNIFPTGKRDYKVLFQYKERKTNQWIQSSNGNFKLFNSSQEEIMTLNTNDIIMNKCNLTKLSTQELYDHIKLKTGLNYSGIFQGVRECFIGIDCSLSIISLELSKDSIIESPSFFNTSIMDCCFHGMIALINDQCQIVFDKVEGFTYYSSRIPKDKSKHSNCYVYSKLNSRSVDSFSASVAVFLNDGTILFEIESAFCKSLIPIKDSLSIEYPTNEIYSSYFQSKDSLIDDPLTFDNLYKLDEFIPSDEYKLLIPEYRSFIATCLFNNI